MTSPSPSPSAAPRTADLDTITTALEELCQPLDAAGTIVHFAAAVGRGDDRCTWHGTVAQLAEHVTGVLHRAPGHDTVIDDTTVPRNPLLDGGQLLDAYLDLQGQPWYPPRAGDQITVHYEATDHLAAFGETYALDRLQPSHPQVSRETFALRLVHHTAAQHFEAGLFAPGPTTETLTEIWAEAGADRITVLRDGVVVHNGPATKAV
ncbi:hypothetical protein ACEZCY_14475 [Streptacidiphilus sp. N1-12]|uniref:Uncharacterized protein n=2 Tax=Streptacidiphilus alkalitolerans TaxID=3342712 RepID=A0ABV6WEJ5_9ACTN